VNSISLHAKNVQIPYSEVEGYLREGAEGYKILSLILTYHAIMGNWPTLRELAEFYDRVNVRRAYDKIRAYLNKKIKNYGTFKSLFLSELEKESKVMLQAYTTYIFKDGKEVHIKLQDVIGIVASIDRPWLDLTPEHRMSREIIEDELRKFKERGKAQPVTMIGAIGSGKTQLCYHAFKYCYFELNVPALYIRCDKILREIIKKYGKDARITQSELYDIISNIAMEGLEKLYERIKSKGNIGELSDFLPDAPPRMNIIDYFRKKVGFIDEDKLLKIIDEGIKNEKCVLIIDEVEVTYDELRKHVIERTGIFRELFDKINTGASKVYAMFSLGYVSAYEASAEIRRTALVILPLIGPYEVRKYYPQLSVGEANAIWWLSRGRVGWMGKFANELQAYRDPETVYRYLSKIELSPGVKVLAPDTIALAEKIAKKANVASKVSNVEKLILALVLNIVKPLNIDEFISILKRYGLEELNVSTLNSLGLIYLSKEKRAVDEFVEAFLTDMERNIEGLNKLFASYKYLKSRVRSILRDILSAISDGNLRICLGGLRPYYNALRDFVVPLIIYLHDVLVEIGEEELLEVADKIYTELISRYGLTTLYTQYTAFTPATREVEGELFKIFRETLKRVDTVSVDNLSEAQFIAPTLRLLVDTYSRPIVAPVISLEGESVNLQAKDVLMLIAKSPRTSIDEISELFKEIVGTSAINDVKIRPLVLPIMEAEESLMLAVLKGYISLIDDIIRLKETRSLAAIFLLPLIREKSIDELISDIKEKLKHLLLELNLNDEYVQAILDDIGNIVIIPVSEKRYVDFLTSITYHVLKRPGGVKEVLENLRKSRDVRRKIDYYFNSLRNYFNEVLGGAKDVYIKNIEKLFGELPKEVFYEYSKGLKRALERARFPRTLDMSMLAHARLRDRERAVTDRFRFFLERALRESPELLSGVSRAGEIGFAEAVRRSSDIIYSLEKLLKQIYYNNIGYRHVIDTIIMNKVNSIAIRSLDDILNTEFYDGHKKLELTLLLSTVLGHEHLSEQTLLCNSLYLAKLLEKNYSVIEEELKSMQNELRKLISTIDTRIKDIKTSLNKVNGLCEKIYGTKLFEVYTGDFEDRLIGPLNAFLNFIEAEKIQTMAGPELKYLVALLCKVFKARMEKVMENSRLGVVVEQIKELEEALTELDEKINTLFNFAKDISFWISKFMKIEGKDLEKTLSHNVSRVLDEAFKEYKGTYMIIKVPRSVEEAVSIINKLEEIAKKIDKAKEHVTSLSSKLETLRNYLKTKLGEITNNTKNTIDIARKMYSQLVQASS